MTTITGDQTLGDIVNRRPDSARVLSNFGLDFCCGGMRTLDTAAAEAGLDPERVIAALHDVAPQSVAEWVSMNPLELVDHIESTHHEYLHSTLGYLESLAQKVFSVHGDHHPELAGVSEDVSALRADLEPHLLKEEQILFPMIRRIVRGESSPSGLPPVHAPISVMTAEHEATGDLLDKLRTDSGGFLVPADGCASYRALYEGLERLDADTRLHVHKENNVLFPAVLRLNI